MHMLYILVVFFWPVLAVVAAERPTSEALTVLLVSAYVRSMKYGVLQH